MKTKLQIEQKFSYGGRSVTFQVEAWHRSGRRDPETGEPLITLDGEQMDRAQEALEAAWLRKYGEALPTVGAAGQADG